MSILGFTLFSGCGSKSSDIPGTDTVPNPLPACPESPNCIRTTQKIDHPIDSVFAASKATFDEMKPEQMAVTEENYRIETVFRVVFFWDDMVVQLTKRDSSSTYLHTRSASRVGESDLGVNTRRVNTFLNLLSNHLD